MKKQKEKQIKPKSKARKIISWVITGVFGVLFVCVLTIQIIANTSKSSNYGVPNFGGMQVCIVLTDSMETKYMVGSAVFVKKVDVSTLKKGDDITFYYPEWKSQLNIEPIVTHQIYDIKIDETKQAGKGRYTFQCHGINKNSENCHMTSATGDRDCTGQYQLVQDKYVLGKVVHNSQFIGVLYKFVTSIWGLIILLGVPVLYVISTTIYDLVKGLKETEPALENGSNNKGKQDILSNLSEEEKERLKREMLEKMMEKDDK